MLGSNAGTVHHQRQGTGLATVLGPSVALRDFMQIDDREHAEAAAREAAKAAAIAADKKKMLEFNPERWVKHEVDLRGMQESWIDEGAKMMGRGVNPNNGTDPESIEWRNKKNRIEAYANASKQVKDMHKSLRAKIDGAEPDKYDPQSLSEINKFFDTPISDIVEKGVLPPALVQRKPTANLQKAWVGLMGDLQSRTGQGEFTDKDRWDFISQVKGANEDIEESALSYYASLPKSMQAAYQQRSQSTGKAVTDLVHYDFMTRYEKPREAFDLNKYIQQGADAIDVPYSQVSTPSGYGTYVDKKELKGIADQKATLMLSGSPEAIQAYESVLPMRESENEAEYRQRAIADLSNRLQGLKATKTASGVTEKGEGDQEERASSERWLQDIKSPDKQVTSEAAGYLFQTPGVFGLQVDVAEVLPEHPLYAGPKNLVITLKGNPSLRQVEGEMKDKFGDAEFEYQTLNNHGILRIPITLENENRLLRLHDKAFKDTKKAYRGPLQTRKVQDIMSGSTWKF